MPESGEFTTIADLAEHEGIAPSYITRVLRLTLLARDIVKAIVDGKQGAEVKLARVLEAFPAEWEAQRPLSDSFGTSAPTLVLIQQSSRGCVGLIQFFWRLLVW